MLRTNGHPLRSLSFSVHVERIEAFRASFTNLLVQSRHDLFFEKIERVDDFVVRQVADVEHAHEMIRADLLHLALNLFRNAVGIAGDQIAAVDKALPIELGKIMSLAVAFAEIAERAFAG